MPELVHGLEGFREDLYNPGQDTGRVTGGFWRSFNNRKKWKSGIRVGEYIRQVKERAKEDLPPRIYTVDFVLKGNGRVTAVEVTSSRRRHSLPGMSAFAAAFQPQRQLLVGGQGVPLEEFLSVPAEKWLNP